MNLGTRNSVLSRLTDHQFGISKVLYLRICPSMDGMMTRCPLHRDATFVAPTSTESKLRGTSTEPKPLNPSLDFWPHLTSTQASLHPKKINCLNHGALTAVDPRLHPVVIWTFFLL